MTIPPLSTLAPSTPDPIFAIAQAAKAAGPSAINGTIGVYMDEDGKPMLFPSVKLALEDMTQTLTERSYSYPALTGIPDYRVFVQELIFGTDHPWTMASLATTGGTGAIAMNLRLIAMLQKDAAIIFPTPTWANHKQLCAEAGVKMIDCAYLSDGKTTIEGIVDAVQKAKAPAAVLLHAGCHNPTGLDMTRSQWEELLPILRDHNAIALMDFAYQGFAGEPADDAFAIRRAAELGVTTLACWSASKNHGLYGERVGLAAAVTPDDATKQIVEGHYMVLTRKIHSAAATFGQSVVIQTQKVHQKEWLQDLKAARENMTKKRRGLKEKLPEKFQTSLNGFGMFAVLPLSPAQIERLKTEHNVFLTGDGRINIAGIPLKRIAELAEKIRAVL